MLPLGTMECESRAEQAREGGGVTGGGGGGG